MRNKNYFSEKEINDVFKIMNLDSEEKREEMRSISNLPIPKKDEKKETNVKFNTGTLNNINKELEDE